jgi:hypothetical protein
MCFAGKKRAVERTRTADLTSLRVSLFPTPTPLKMAVLQVLITLLSPSSMRQYRQISPLLLTLLLTIADASFLGSGWVLRAGLLSNRYQP